MCQRASLIGAVVADDSGLPLALHNSPVQSEALAAFTSVLADALDTAGRLLGEHRADNISLDVNYTDKAVLRRFQVKGGRYSIMVICSQEIDPRSELELSIDQMRSILSRPSPAGSEVEDHGAGV